MKIVLNHLFVLKVNCRLLDAVFATAKRNGKTKRDDPPPKRGQVVSLEEKKEIADSGSTKAREHDTIARIIQENYEIMVLNGEVYVRKHIYWQKIDSNSISTLYDCLPPGTEAGLTSRDDKEIYRKLRTNRDLVRKRSELIENPGLVPCEDGLYDIENGIACDVDSLDEIPDVFYTLNVSVYDIVDDTCPYYDHFLATSLQGCEDVIQRFEEMMGVLLTTYRLKNIFFIMGVKDAGKGTATRLLCSLLENEGNGQLVRSYHHPNELSKRFGTAGIGSAMILLCPDCPDEAFSQRAVGLIKQISGLDMIFSEDKNEKGVSSRTYAKVLICSNHSLRGLDEFLQRRLVGLSMEVPAL